MSGRGWTSVKNTYATARLFSVLDAVDPGGDHRQFLIERNEIGTSPRN